MKWLVLLLSLCMLPPWKASAQSASPKPAFEVADIQASQGNNGPRKERMLPGGRIEIPYATLKDLMTGAFLAPGGLIFGGPKWADTDHFDIVAKASDPNAPVPTLMLMLRTLLEERFKLVTHREDRVMAAYALAVLKDGPKLRRAADISVRMSCSTQPVPGARILRRLCRNMTMGDLTRQIGMGGFGIDAPVVDETGLTGSWDFEFDFSPAATRGAPIGGGEQTPGAAPPPPDGPTIYEAMTQLGLKLSAGKRTISVIMIDSAEKPGEN